MIKTLTKTTDGNEKTWHDMTTHWHDMFHIFPLSPLVNTISKLQSLNGKWNKWTMDNSADERKTLKVNFRFPFLHCLPPREFILRQSNQRIPRIFHPSRRAPALPVVSLENSRIGNLQENLLESSVRGHISIWEQIHHGIWIEKKAPFIAVLCSEKSIWKWQSQCGQCILIEYNTAFAVCQRNIQSIIQLLEYSNKMYRVLSNI